MGKGDDSDSDISLISDVEEDDLPTSLPSRSLPPFSRSQATSWADVDQSQLKRFAHRIIHRVTNDKDENDAFGSRSTVRTKSIQPSSDTVIGLLESSALAADPRAQPSSAMYDPEVHAALALQSASWSDLVSTVERLRYEVHEHAGQLKILVKDNFDRFINSRDTIEDVATRLEAAEAEGGTGVHGATPRAVSTGVNAAQQAAHNMVGTMLERHEDGRGLERVLSMLGQYDVLVTMPSRVCQLTEERDFIGVVLMYKKSLQLIREKKGDGAVWQKLKDEMDKSISSAVHVLQATIRSPLSSPRAAFEAVVHLMQLQYAGVSLVTDTDAIDSFITAQQEGISAFMQSHVRECKERLELEMKRKEKDLNRASKDRDDVDAFLSFEDHAYNHNDDAFAMQALSMVTEGVMAWMIEFLEALQVNFIQAMTSPEAAAPPQKQQQKAAAAVSTSTQGTTIDISPWNGKESAIDNTLRAVLSTFEECVMDIVHAHCKVYHSGMCIQLLCCYVEGCQESISKISTPTVIQSIRGIAYRIAALITLQLKKDTMAAMQNLSNNIALHGGFTDTNHPYAGSVDAVSFGLASADSGLLSRTVQVQHQAVLGRPRVAYSDRARVPRSALHVRSVLSKVLHYVSILKEVCSEVGVDAFGAAPFSTLVASAAGNPPPINTGSKRVDYVHPADIVLAAITTFACSVAQRAQHEHVLEETHSSMMQSSAAVSYKPSATSSQVTCSSEGAIYSILHAWTVLESIDLHILPQLIATWEPLLKTTADNSTTSTLLAVESSRTYNHDAQAKNSDEIITALRLQCQKKLTAAGDALIRAWLDKKLEILDQIMEDFLGNVLSSPLSDNNEQWQPTSSVIRDAHAVMAFWKEAAPPRSVSPAVWTLLCTLSMLRSDISIAAPSLRHNIMTEVLQGVLGGVQELILTGLLNGAAPQALHQLWIDLEVLRGVVSEIEGEVSDEVMTMAGAVCDSVEGVLRKIVDDICRNMQGGGGIMSMGERRKVMEEVCAKEHGDWKF